jgi:hypothetical protein
MKKETLCNVIGKRFLQESSGDHSLREREKQLFARKEIAGGGLDENGGTKPTLLWWSQRVVNATTHILPRRSEPLWIVANALSLIALSLFMFWHQVPVTFYNFDGTFILNLAKNQPEWMPELGVYTMDLLKGLGGQWYPIDTRLIGGFALGLLAGDGDWLPVISATVFAFELAAATVLLGRSLGLEVPVTVLAAWAGVLGAMPYLIPPPFVERTWGNPHFLSMISWTNIAVAIFVQLGRGSAANTVILAAGVLAILSYLATAYPLLALMWVPVFGFFALTGLAMAENRPELRLKFAAALAIAAIFLAIFGPFLAGIVLYGKATFFWSELYRSPITWRWASLLVEYPGRPAGAVFLAFGVTGALLALPSANRKLARFAAGYLVFVILGWATTLFLGMRGSSWPAQPIAYLDWMIYPLHALFAAFLSYSFLCRINRSLCMITRTVESAPNLPGLIMGATLLLPWLVFTRWTPPYDIPLFRNQVPFAWPPARTQIVDFLEREIALRKGQPFRGRVANLAGASFSPQYSQVPFINQHIYDGAMAYYTGNDHRGYGFWFYNIPTLADANQASSPFLHLLTAHLLNPPDGISMRAHISASAFEPRILAEIGVRFVVTEEPLAGRVPVLTVHIVESRKQYLYELPKANVNGHGLTEVTVVSDAAAAVRRLAASTTDLSREAVLFEPLPRGALVPLTKSEIIVGDGFLTVHAESSGRSLLILPFEFTRCLEFSWEEPGSMSPQAYRANLDQVAILFTGRVDGRISLKNGPFANPLCRLQDYRDAVRLKLGGAAWPRNG